MHQAPTSIKRMRGWINRWITATLFIAAAVAVASGIWLSAGPADTEPLESPLLLSVARQLDLGPWGLYGPYGRQNPLVLIHAPLYYHFAAILAWPLHTAGLDAITAARLAGRALSFAGLLLAGWSAFRIARLDGAPVRAGWWAACLVAGTPVLGAIPFTVRPDMIGVGLQTTGVWLILRALQSQRPRAMGVVGGFAAFGLAICVKQHFVGGPVVATMLLLWAAWKGRASGRLVGLGVLTAAALVAGVGVIEELATGGRMSQAIFVAAAASARVHPTDWVRGAIVLANIGGGTSCLMVLLTLAGLAQVTSKRGKGRAAVAVGGTIVAGSVLFLPLAHHLRPSVVTGLAMSAAPFVCMFVVIPVCAVLERRALFGSSLDGALCLFAVTEIAIVVPLCLASTGAWVNYAIQGMVFVAILTGRSLARACEAAGLRMPLIMIAAAAFALVCLELEAAHSTYFHQRLERLSAEMVLSNLTEPNSELYFAGGPGRNRQYGRTDLVFDHWLYPVFESVHGAEPRSIWLRSALTDGSVRFVITTSKDPRIDGLDEPLTSLGYVGRIEIASLYVWEQVRAAGRRRD
jgi:hypothetical protein